jgi:polyphosphate kinase 2 (PPK2 family)
MKKRWLFAFIRSSPNFSPKKTFPPSLITRHVWDERFQDIRSFERYLRRNGIVLMKFFLHVSKEEPKLRFLERADSPEKNWKVLLRTMAERDHWDAYQKAYEDTIRNTATKASPW